MYHAVDYIEPYKYAYTLYQRHHVQQSLFELSDLLDKRVHIQGKFCVSHFFGGNYFGAKNEKVNNSFVGFIVKSHICLENN